MTNFTKDQECKACGNIHKLRWVNQLCLLVHQGIIEEELRKLDI